MQSKDGLEVVATREAYWVALSSYQDRRVVDPIESAEVERLGDLYRRAARAEMVCRWIHVFDLTMPHMTQAKLARIRETGRASDILDGMEAWLDATCSRDGYGRWTCDIWGWPDYVGITDRDQAKAFIRRWMFGRR